MRPSELRRKTAKRLLHLHPLRTADSLPLAAAVTRLCSRSSSGDFVRVYPRVRAATYREELHILAV